MPLFDVSRYVNEQEPDQRSGPRQEAALDCHRRHLRRGPAVALEGRLESESSGWVLRIPLRAERVTIEKQTRVVEEVAVGTAPVQHATRVQDSIRREELDVQPHASQEATQRVRWGE